MLKTPFYVKTTSMYFSGVLLERINAVKDESANGKSVLCDLVTAPDLDTDCLFFPQINIKRIDLIPEVVRDRIVIIDEVYIPRMKGMLRLITRHAKHVLYIYRSKLPDIHVSSKAIFTLHSTGASYSLERKYKYDFLPKCNSYICEDSNSGFQYFSTNLSNVEKGHGKGNIINEAITKQRDCVIADALGFGEVLEKYKDIVKNLEFYLPDSFEAILGYRLFGIAAMRNNMFTTLNTEQLLEDNLISLCQLNNMPVYAKSKLDPYYKDIDCIVTEDTLYQNYLKEEEELLHIYMGVAHKEYIEETGDKSDRGFFNWLSQRGNIDYVTKEFSKS